MPSLKNVVTVGRFLLDKAGVIKSAKGGGFSAFTAGVTGLLVAQGLDVVTAGLLGALAGALANTAYQFVRQYEVVAKE